MGQGSLWNIRSQKGAPDPGTLPLSQTSASSSKAFKILPRRTKEQADPLGAPVVFSSLTSKPLRCFSVCNYPGGILDLKRHQ